MTRSVRKQSAKIYQFPSGGRAGLGDRRDGQTKSPIDLDPPRVNEALCSDNWYHEEAIQESNPTWER
jgi:hypothetical protein